ncbi:hypothetical protein LINGRAHAP2_LOCUS35505 [Linum grandiflorum]
MASVCIHNCVNDATTRDPRVPVRTTYVSLHRWTESDPELIKSVRRVGQGIQHQRPRVVDSISCRQMYLRSYTFSRKETVPEKTRKCFGKVKDKVSSCGGGHQGKNRKGGGGRGRRKGGGGGRKCMVLRKVKEMSCRIFHRLLSCATSVDVVHPKD